MRVSGILVTLLLCTSTLTAADIAELRNGFTIVHRSREIHDGQVRLFLDDARQSFIDLPADEIAGYSTQPDPKPSTAAPAKDTNQIVNEASEKQGVDSDFIRSVIQQESAGNEHAVSRAGAQGLMQLMPQTASQLGVGDSFSPEQNVRGGTRYLRELLERYNGDAVKALAAYNAGPEAVDRYKGVPPYRETQEYVRRVIRNYNRSKERNAKSKSVVASKRKTTTAHAAN